MMKAAFFVLEVVAIAFSLVFAQPPEIAAAGRSRTKATPINTGGRNIRCPPNFQQKGKDCISVLLQQPRPSCPSGFERLTERPDQCIKYYEKVIGCPPSFKLERDICIRPRRIEPTIECPDNFSLTDDGLECIGRVPLPAILYCPNGLTPTEDGCLQIIQGPAKFVCRDGLRLTEHNHCAKVRQVDCTPSKEHQHHEYGSHGHLHHFVDEERGFAQEKERGQHMMREVGRSCEQVHTEPSRIVCPDDFRIEGKECLGRKRVPFSERDGGLKEAKVRAKVLCPDGQLTPSKERPECMVPEKAPTNRFCPENTQRVGQRCAVFKPLVLECPQSYSLLDNKFCAKSVVAPTITQWDVTYQCEGKDCGS